MNDFPILDLVTLSQDAGALCEACRIIPSGLEMDPGEMPILSIGYPRMDQYPEFPELLTSADLGCGFCGFLRLTSRAAYKRHYPFVDLQSIEIGRPTFHYSNGKRHDPYLLSFALKDSNESIETVNFTISTTGSSTSGYQTISGRLCSQNALSPHNTVWIERWTNSCIHGHARCGGSEESILPSKVLNVGNIDDPLVHLLCTENQVGKYVALSHCWGKPSPDNPFFKTTAQNLAQRIEGIHVSEMPNMFRDAVAVARALDIRYLWIDSLCIIQDSEQDWLEESRKMHQIYQNAYLTVAVTSAVASNQGFLERILNAPIRMTEHSSDGSSHYFYLQHRESHRDWDNDVEDTTWNRRGWTLQERSLSHRIAYFAKDKIWLECRESISAENEDTTAYKATKWSDLLTSNYQLVPMSYAMLVVPDKYNEWYRIVTEYTKRDLSNQLDRLPAIFGLASQMPYHIATNYHYGMWFSDFRRGLIWSRATAKHLAINTASNIPSWSWASVIGPVQWESSTYSPTYNDEDIAWHITDSDAGRYLAVTGKLIELILCGGGQSGCRLSAHQKENGQFTRCLFRHSDLESFKELRKDAKPPATAAMDSPDGYCRDVYVLEVLGKFGLVLEKCGYNKMYRRVGVYQQTWRDLISPNVTPAKICIL